MPRNYWMVVLSPGNFVVTRDQGFTIQGFPSNMRRKAERMEAGDRMLFFISEVQKFAATTTVTATYFEEHTPLWKSHRPEEDFPYRVHLEPAVVIDDEADFIDALEVSPRMEYVKKWIPERWPLAFVGMLHLIPRKDFSFLEEEMKKIVNRKKKKAKSKA